MQRFSGNAEQLADDSADSGAEQATVTSGDVTTAALNSASSAEQPASLLTCDYYLFDTSSSLIRLAI